MKIRFLRIIAMAVAAVAAIASGFMSGDDNTVYASDMPCYIMSDNTEKQNYDVWSEPIYSHLTTTDSGYMRVQGVSDSGAVAIEYYDNSFNRTGIKEIPQELPNEV